MSCGTGVFFCQRPEDSLWFPSALKGGVFLRGSRLQQGWAQRLWPRRDPFPAGAFPWRGCCGAGGRE